MLKGMDDSANAGGLTRLFDTIDGLDQLPFDQQLLDELQRQSLWSDYILRDGLNLSMPSFRTHQHETLIPAAIKPWPAVSITGGRCELQCDHCKGRILESMTAVHKPQQLQQLVDELVGQGGEGLLLTGGSDHQNVIPYEPFLPVLEHIHTQYPDFTIAVHTGLADRQQAQALADAGVKVVMMDVIGAQDTITQVYHLKRQVADFERSLAWLCETGVQVVPHIVIGLHYGQLLGEWQALEIIGRYPVSGLVLVVVMPHLASPRRRFRTPDVNLAGRFMMDARRALPDTRIQLGCARPPGIQRLMLEVYAVLAGLNGIAYASDEVLQLLEHLAIPVRLSARCCSSVEQSPVREIQTVNVKMISANGSNRCLSAFDRYPLQVKRRVGVS